MTPSEESLKLCSDTAISDIEKYVLFGDSQECWEWLGRKRKGYGRCYIGNGKFRPSHRVAYMLLIGEYENGLILDHLCRNNGCCNPSHLEPVTPRENTLRGFGPTAINARKKFCPKGHPYSKGNIYLTKEGWRYCYICKLEKDSQRWSKKSDV